MVNIIFSYCLAGKEALVCDEEKEEVVQVKAQQVLVKINRSGVFNGFTLCMTNFKPDGLTDAGDVCEEEQRIQVDIDLLPLSSLPFYPPSPPLSLQPPSSTEIVIC